MAAPMVNSKFDIIWDSDVPVESLYEGGQINLNCIFSFKFPKDFKCFILSGHRIALIFIKAKPKKRHPYCSASEFRHPVNFVTCIS